MEVKKELNESLKMLANNGYKCYTTTPEGWNYGYIITPKDNVLYIQWEYFGGWSFSLQYKASYSCGTGCKCFDEPIFDITVSEVERAELEGLRFAMTLKAPLYKNSDEWLSKYWAKDRLLLVESEGK